MLYVYPAVFHEENNHYWVEFPDLEGCYSSGESVNEALLAAQEALSAYLLTLVSQGKTFAAPREITSLSVTDGFATLVSCTLNPYKDTRAVKKTLTIPAWLNDLAVSKGLNFSQILQEALMARLLSC